jgi:DHA1 family bicyclomycin/chloramphenicol resistance-like MFS transporter
MENARVAEMKPGLGLYLLALMGALGPMTIDMYLPVVAAMGEDLNASPTEATASVSVILIGLGFGQIVFGPLSDKVGRRPLLVGGLAGTALGALICLFSPSIMMLLSGRLLQALGSAAILVTARAAIRDQLDENNSAGFFSIMTTVASLAVIASPLIGAAMLVSFGWRSIFAVVAALALLILVPTCLYLPESHRERDGPRKKHPLRAYAALLSNKGFLGFLLCTAANGGAYFAYISLSPLALMQAYSLSPTTYGLIMSVNGGALILSTQVNRLLLKRWSARQLLHFVSIGALVMAAALACWAITGVGGVWGLVVLCFVMSCSGGFVQPNGLAAGMSLAQSDLGTAAALFGSFTFLAGTLVSIVGAMFFDGTALSMVVLIIVALLAMGLSLWALTTRSGLTANEAQ